ncbi:unnamed protein product [Toxocara canis]|uniref:Transposase n=2 Tax=Toxocara canis TaxID=6265 RepID=A0A183V508_TOXCA|nr:unnamed protein product [Toxocara canis]
MFCNYRYEPIAMSQCKHEINQSLVGSNLFSEAVVNREQYNIRTRFGSLCRDLGHMIKCIEPVTRSGCGEDAARMMLKFITVGFARHVISA